MTHYKTSESVTEGHPDKVCDIISDGIVDLFLSKDSDAMVSIKMLAARDLVCISGEVGGVNCYTQDISEKVRSIIKEIGYTNSADGFCAETVKIIDCIERHEINEKNKWTFTEENVLGSRDQGIVFGYACIETEQCMPLPITLAHNLARNLTKLRKQNILPYLRPDGKTQVTIAYENNKPIYADTIVISTMHDPSVLRSELENDLLEKLIIPTLHFQTQNFFNKKTKVFINPTGRFIVGGPAIDTGITGRKLIVDSYGEAARHGGGAFSGKDPTSSDRCGAYLARYIAKNLVNAEIAKEIEIGFSYAIGCPKPLHITIDTKDTSKYTNKQIEKIIDETFDTTITKTITNLELRKISYLPTAAYGHFGRKNFPWERLDKIEKIQEVMKHV